MKVSRKPAALIPVVIISVLILQYCLTLTKGSSQRIPITSNLRDARVFVDGKEIGITPLNVLLQKNRDHVIRIEKPGYNPFSIVTIRQRSGGGRGLTEVTNALV